MCLKRCLKGGYCIAMPSVSDTSLASSSASSTPFHLLCRKGNTYPVPSSLLPLENNASVYSHINMEHLEAPHWERLKGECIFLLLGILASRWYCSVGGKARLRNSPPGEFSLNQSSLGRSYRPFLSTLKHPQTPNLGDNSSVLQMLLSQSEFPTMAGSLICQVL